MISARLPERIPGHTMNDLQWDQFDGTSAEALNSVATERDE
ncbi:hypothetical protein [Amycolatopsis sp. GM8]|nr:hypothetical protein [Amycolatopsis sp. GM8]